MQITNYLKSHNKSYAAFSYFRFFHSFSRLPWLLAYRKRKNDAFRTLWGSLYRNIALTFMKMKCNVKIDIRYRIDV